MNKLVASIALGVAAIVSVPALAADPVSYDYPVYKDYVPPYVPPVDMGLKGSFYLRGSLGGNMGWFREVVHPTYPTITYPTNAMGWGYSAGIGAGFETGDGLRFDVTVDHLSNEGIAANIPDAATPGVYKLKLRSTLALANAYYDFGLGNLGLSAAGGAFAYVGAGAGVAFNRVNTMEPAFPNGPSTLEGPWGGNTSFAAAGMVGVGYDFGAVVADLGYRGVYINKLENATAPQPYSIDNMWVHELRASLRYRFN